MDPPPPFHHRRRHHHHHHHHRYVPHPPNFPDSNPNNFLSHHRLPPPPPLPPPPHHHLPPPPPLPPPPSLPPPPPPQHFALHHHHRPRPPIDDHLSQNSNFIPPHLLSPPPPPPSRVSSSHRNEDNTNFNNNFNNYHHQHNRWVEPPPGVRVPPDQQFPPPPPPPPPPHDNGYHPGLSFRPDIDDFERNDGFLDEFYGDDRFMNNTNGNRDVSVVNNDEERRWGRKDLDFDIIGDDERYSFAPRDRYRNVDCFDESLSRDCPPNVGNYEVYDERDEDPRWGCYSPRNVGMEIDNMFGSSRRELFLDSFGSGRYRDNDRAREGRQGFFSRSPRKKQVQKKSALLRIQLGKGIKSNRNRNRVHESNQYSRGYFDESSSAGAGLWGKEKDGLVQSDCRVEEKREKSPVQLDVSFKSNSLVAKAIVTPSSPTVDCRSSTPRNRKIRKINFSSSPLTKPSENSCKPNNSVTGLDGLSISGKRRKLSSDNIVSADGSASGCGPQPGSSGRNDVAENATTTGSPKMKALDGDGNSAGASGTPFRRIIQRKKITATPLHESVPQPPKDTDELTKADKSMDNPTAVSQLGEGMKHPGQSDASAVRVSAHGIVLSHCSNEAGSVSEKNDTDVDSSRPFSAAFPNSSSHSNTDSYTSQSKVDTVITDEADQADRSNHNSGSVSNLDTSLVQLQSKSALSGSDRFVEFTKHPCQDGGPLPENALRGGSFEVSVLVDGYLNSILSSTKKMGIPVVHPDTSNPDIDDHPHTYASDHAENIVTDSKPECSEKAGVIAVDDVGSSDPGTKEFLGNQTIVSFENDAHENVKNSSCSNHSLGVTRLIISSSTGCLGQGNISDPCSLDDGIRKSCFDLSTVPLDNDHSRGPPKAVVSVGSSEDNSQKVERKRKTSDALLNLYGSGASDVPVNVGSCRNGEDEGIISLVNDVCVAKEVCHPDYHNDTLCGNSLGGDPLNVIVSDQDAFGIDANVFPIYGKKRKPDEGLNTAATSTFSSNVSSCVDIGTSASEVRIVLESADLLSSLLPTGTLNENSTARASFQAQSTGDGASKKSKTLELLSFCSPQFGADPEKDAASAISVTNHQFGTVDMVSQGSANQLCDMEMDQRVPGKDCECDDSLPVKYNLEFVLNRPSLCDNGEGASAVNSVDELIDSFSDSRSHMCSPENSVVKSPSEVDDFKASVSHISDDNVCQNDKERHKWPLSASDSELDRRAGQGIARKPPIGIKTASSLSKGTSKVTPNLNSVWVKSNLSNNYLSSSVPQVFSGRPSLNFTASRKAATLNHIAKPRTWHRTGNPSGSVRGPMTQLNPIPQQNNTRKKVGTLQSSYTRKGNSLVRNPSPIAAVSKGVHASGSLVYRFNSSGVDDSKKGKESDANLQISTIHGGSLATNERPQTPPLCLANKSLSTAALSLNDSTSLPGSEPTESFSAVTTSGPLEFTTNMNLLKSSEEITKSSGLPECHTGSIKNYEDQSTQDEKNLGKKIIYVKRRSNQLVAALGAGDVSLRCVDKTQASSDGYYKRRKNQLIRRLLENHVEESVAAADDSQKQDNQKFKQSGKSNSKSYKPFKFSLVWTLRETESSKSDVSSVRCHKAWPYLFPWKRATYRRNSMFIPNDTSLSLISRKLLLSRKRETIYTRSTNGFSLRRSKVLSVGGSNLKWSKSIERNSKKANEEATLAVAAAEKSKKEQNIAASTVLNRRNHVSRKSVYCIKLRPGERIFRIGSERYKMDPTRNTLHRITNDEDHLCPVPQPEENAKKSYVPRRLLIGNDEYVRVGNGNKLVRDPKKRTRTLASEKVRWSLHTVRLRLAKRRKYCQFFTRFGKCNKEDGKCPYIHDPSKIAVCTKFLNSSCSNPNCKLTHEVIPERMPDCSYFLQGLCSNENCPWRHVNVNPSASICEGFLRGYCADGNECRKKHTYVCPVFEATGVCPQGSKCKLHHPRKRKGTRKPSREQKNARGRYFGSSPIHMVDCRITGSEKLSERSNDDISCQDGTFVEYISLDISNEQVEQPVDSITEQTCDPGPSDAQTSTIDELIKPLRIMNKPRMADSSPAIASHSAMAGTHMLEDS